MLCAPHYQFTGRENDGTGLDYYRARYYSPTRQRFISEDRIGLRGGSNLYAYVFDNPLTWVDPLGLDVTITQWKCCGGFNHIGIGVNITDPKETVGFYPRIRHRPVNLGVVVSDLSRNEPDEFVDTFTIKTTPEQDRLILAYIEEVKTNPGIYNLATRHCGIFVQEALRRARIDPFGDVASPRSLFEAIKGLNDSGVDFTEGYRRRPENQ